MTTPSRHPDPLAPVRSASEAEGILRQHAEFPVIRDAMRRGQPLDRRAVEILLNLARRGYTTDWRIARACALPDVTPDDAARYLIQTDRVTAEPGRDVAAAEWTEITRVLGADFDPQDDDRARLARSTRWWGLGNRAMRDKLERGECVDLATCPRTPDGYYLVSADVYQADVDYCDADTEQWIRSIGRHRETGAIHAAVGSDLYQHPNYECLWLR